jgi:hypothetical protein
MNFLDRLAQAASNFDASNPTAPRLYQAPAVPDTKAAEVAQATQQKMLDAGGRQVAPPVNYNAAAGIMSNQGAASAPEAENDLRTMQPYQLRAKYGDAAAMDMMMSQALAQAQYRGDTTGTRTMGQAIGDTALGIVGGMSNALGGIASLGSGIVSEDAGTALAKGVSLANDAIFQGNQSQDLQGRRKANQAQTAQGIRDNTLQYEQDQKTNSDFIASMKRIGRDAGTAISNAVQDPAILADGTAQGIGSMVVVPAIAKGASILGKAAVPATIGVIEGGGAYQQTADQIMKTSFEDLAKNSPTYNSMLEQGLSPEEARTRIANRSGLTAAAIQAPIAAAAGTLVSKFEGAPLHVPTLRTAAGNLVREGVEEGIQSGTGQVSQNIASKTFANQNQDLTEGVGEQVGQGALYGLGTAGAVQGPGAAARASARVADITARGVVAAGKAGLAALDTATKPIQSWLEERGRKVQQANEEASPVSEEAVTKASTEVVQTAPEATQVLKTAVESAKAAPEVKAQANDYIDRMVSVSQISPEEIGSIQNPEIRDLVSGSTSRADAMYRLAKNITAEDTDSNRQMNMASQLLDYINQYNDVINADASSMTSIQGHEQAGKIFSEYQDLMIAASKNPRIVSALQTAMDRAAGIEIAPVTEASLATPEGQQNIQNAVTKAQLAPEQGNLEANKQILYQAAQGKIQLTDAQRNALELSNSLLDAQEKALQALKDQGNFKEQDRVAEEITTGKTGREGFDYSGRQHSEAIVRSMNAGDTTMAQTLLTDFGKFVQHMQNKVDAVNRDFVSPGSNGTTYQALEKQTRQFGDSGTGIRVLPTKEGSIQFAQRIAAEAQLVQTVYDNLKTAFPQLGEGYKVKQYALNPELVGNAKEISQRFQEATTKEKAPAAEVKQEPKAVQEPVVAEATKPVKTEVAEPVKTLTESAPMVENVQPKVEAKPEVKPEGVAAVYSNLIPQSKLKEAFRLPAEPKTRVVGTEQPVSVIREAMASERKFAAFVGSDLTHEYKGDVVAAYTSYLKNAEPLIGYLEDRLNTYLTKKDKLGARLDKGEEINRWLEAKALNIVEKTEDGYRYNPELIQSATLAGLQWRLNADQFGTIMDAQDVARMVGVDAVQVGNDVIDALNQGMSPQEAVTTLGDKISKFWGLQDNKNAPIGYTKGIPYSIAAEIIEGMIESGTLNRVDIRLDGEGRIVPEGQAIGPDGKTIIRLVPEKMAKDDALREFPNAIETAVVMEPEPVNFIGNQQPPVAKTQLHNPLVENTPEQQQALKNEQSTEFYLNLPMANLYAAMGRDAVITLFGEGTVSPDDYNVNHFASIDGRNRSYAAAFDYLQGLIKETQNVSQKLGTNLDETPIRYAYNMTRLGRMQMLGKYNPQSNKLMREAVLPTRSTIDLNDAADYEKFGLALAQALGVKVHNMSRGDAVSKVETMLSGPLSESVSLLQDWVKTQDKDLPMDTVQTLRTAMAATSGRTTVALHALVEYARFLNSNQLERSAFTTNLYVEADGVTNGPINAMKLLNVGRFTPEWIANMSKGGLTVGENDVALNKVRAMDKKDMYEVTADTLQQNLRNMYSSLGSQPEVQRQMGYLIRMMEIFNPDINIDSEGNLNLSRGITKNPLTITIYGSGADGIAGKMVENLTSQIYQKMSEALQNQKANPKLSVEQAMFGDSPEGLKKARDFRIALDGLMEYAVMPGKEGMRLVESKAKKVGNIDPAKFTFEPEQLKSLQRNMLNMFVEPLRDAITENVGETLMTSATNVRKATQVQSIFLQYAYQEEIQKVLAEKAKDPNWKQTDFLSRAELDGVYARLKNLLPMVKLGDQQFMIASTTNTDVANASLARSLTGGLRTDAFVNAPANAGVAGIPIMVIGAGDAAAMLHLSTMKNAPQNSLKIFDGVNFKLSSLMEDSAKANEAIQASWQGNPLRAVSESFTKFMADVNMDNISEEMNKDLTYALLGKRGETADPADLRANMEALMDSLKYGAQSSEARTKALNTVAQSIDQMAAAGTPFNVKGDTKLTGLSPEQMAAELNTRYTEELKKIQGREDTSENISEELKLVGREHASGARVLSQTALKNLRSLINLPAEQSNLLGEIVRSDAAKQYKIVYGNQEQITKYQDMTGKVGAESTAQDVKGYTNIGDKTIYLINPSSETLVHELIHAATFEKVLAHYQGNTDPVTKGAVERLEILMNQFMSMKDQVSQVAPETRAAFDNARAAINGHLNNTQNQVEINKAAALNEFMAWGLANQALMRLQQRNKANPLVVMAKNVFNAVRDFIWGRKKAPAEGDDMFSGLVFNSSIIIRSQPTLAKMASQGILYQSTAYGQNERLSQIDKAFFDNVTSLVQSKEGVERVQQQTVIRDAVKAATTVGLTAEAVGFKMDMQEASTFRMIVGALATEARINPNALAKVSDLYQHVTKTLKVENFMRDETNDVERYYAQRKYDFIMGNFGIKKDAAGRSSLMPAFLALAVTNQEFRAVLEKMPMPKNVKTEWSTLDNALSDLGNKMMDTLGNRAAGIDKAPSSVRAAIDALSDHIVETTQDRESFFDKTASTTGNAVDRANQYMIDAMTTLSNASLDKAKDLEQGNLLQKTLASALRVTAAVTNEANGERVAEGIMSQANRAKMWEPLHTLLNDLVGRTKSNAEVYDMIKAVRALGQQDRQQFREQLPKIIASKFSRPLEAKEWTAMYNGMAKTDLAAISKGPAEVLKLIQDQKYLDASMLKLENDLRQQDPAHWSKYQAKMQQLATFMTTGETGSNLLRNAYAISNLFGESKQKGFIVKDEAFVKQVDELVSLYALDRLNVGDRTLLSELARSEADGMTFSHQYLIGQRVEEQRKALDSEMAQANQYKGWIPTEQTEGVSLVVADDTESTKLTEKSYVRLAEYSGSSADIFSGSKSYFFSPVSGRAVFNQGILQNVRQTAGGVDVASGYSSRMNAGVISEPAAVERIARQLKNESGIEKLLPVYDSNGKVRAFERTIDPRMLENLQQSTDFAQMIGVWRGRQVEEAKAQKFNEALIDSLHAMYKADEAKSSSFKDEYVNLSSGSVDPVVRDAMKLFTPETMKYIKKVFGDEFYVRKDMLNDALGYRSASVGDAWTGNSRWSPETQEKVKLMIIGAFGNKGYQYAIQSEKYLQNFISSARTMIAVKSVIVPVSNMISNVFQLIGRGVPLSAIASGMPKKTAEVETFVNNRTRIVEAEAELRAAAGDIIAERKLKAELQSLNDANKRLSIWPLIEAGEFSGISDGLQSAEDNQLFKGKLADYMETLADKLPGGLKTMGKYALVTKDTALFQGLHKAVTYGDFLAKTILYDDLTQRQKRTKEEALALITEEFVNYDRLPGRFRGYLESTGLLWFYNFKIRSTKVALSMIRNNPVHAMLATAGAIGMPHTFGTVGLPTQDNLITKAWDGSLSYSIGPNMAGHAAQLNPWWNLTH